MAPIPTFGTAIPAIPQVEGQKPLDLSPRAQCKLDGGVWDVLDNICVFPKKETPVKEEAPKVEPKDIEVFDFAGGKKGVTTPGGKRFLANLSPEEIESIRAGEQRQDIGGEPIGISPAGTAQAQADEEFRLQQAVAQIGQIGTLTAAENVSANISQALTAGTVGSLPSILKTAGGFAAGGLIAGGPVGAAIGAAAGVVAGVVGGIIGNIKEQQRGELKAADIELTNARTNMRQLAMLASQDPANADVYIQQYNQQLTRIIQARRQTQAEVKGDLNAWMEDGREQLADFDAFLQPGGIADVYGQKLSIALTTGVPLSLTGDELF